MADVEFKQCLQEHIALIDTQEKDDEIKHMYLAPDFRAVLVSHFSMSAWAEGVCVGAAGIMPVHGFRAMAWALLGVKSGPYMRQITRKVKGAIAMSPYTRIEMLVDSDFASGHKWANMLGFVLEAPRMRRHGLYGNDESLYARVKNDI